MKLKVVACGVFDRELRLLAEKSQNRLEVELLDAGLHARPHELRLRAQEAIDRASRTGDYDAVVLVYGLCGRGISGLVARTIPVVVPRVHDCVSLFLGSRDEYRRQFAAHPGTMYMTSGWFEKKVHPKTPKPVDHQKRENPEAHPKFREYAAQYGEDNAAYIIGFFDSWKRNYTRAAFIEHGLGDSPTYERYTRSMAEGFGWQFAKIPGSLRILDKLVNGPWDAEDVLVVKPGERVAMSTHEGLIEGLPMDRADAMGTPRGVDTRRVVVGRRAPPTRAEQDVLGLGVDAGGTYTDAVLYEFATRKGLCKGKALTTPHDYTIGIVGAIDHLDKSLFPRVKLVSLSTTLATNSIVEGRGARVGLIFMPHMPEAAAELHVEPKRRVRGQIGIAGQELEPLDPDEVRAVVDELAHRERVQAFAVSGFGGVMNPAHENQIKAIITEGCGLPVVCGHELSAKLDFIKRANTAVLNARLVPIIGELMDSVKKALHEHGIDAALMVVKGDGTLMSEAVARQRPIETILSGPAASATGAHFLTDKPDAIAIDMGGTTTDTALLDHGRVAVTEEGATVGEWKTSVEAVEMLTTGLGGDSYLRLDHDLRIHVGPERVIPLAYLASEHPKVHDTLDRLAALASEDSAPSHILDFFTLTGRHVRVKLDERERQLLDALAAGPQARVDLSKDLGYMAPSLLRVERLEQLGLVRRAAVTPTDMLHVTGEFVEWSREAATVGLQALASLMRVSVDDAAARIRREVVRRLAMEIIRKLVSKHVDSKWLETCRSCGLMLDNLFAGRGRKEFAVTFKVERPIVAIGAPVHPFMPEVARILNAELVIPDHADVANAIGAIVSQVLIRETMRIRQNDTGGYVLHSPHEKREFPRIESAQRYAEDHLVKLLRDRAAKYGTDELDVTLEVHEREGHLAKGEVVFLERVVEGSIAGKPVARTVDG